MPSTSRIVLSTLLPLQLSMSGCYTGIEPPRVAHAEFETPPGWSVVYDDPGYTSIMKDAPEDHPISYYKLETIPLSIFDGDDESARNYIAHLYDHLARPGEPVATMEPLTFQLSSGFTMHASVTPEASWGEEGDGTVFAFSKDGYVIPIYINDYLGDHLDDVDVIAESMKISTRERVVQ